MGGEEPPGPIGRACSHSTDEPGEYKGTHQPTPSTLDLRNWQSPEPTLAQVEGKASSLSHPQWEILANKRCSALEFRLQAPTDTPSL